MCRYTRSTYTCGHYLEIRVTTSDRCHDIPCPPVELTLKSMHRECARCSRHKATAETIRRAENNIEGWSGENKTNTNATPEFNPFLGQAGQLDERTYRENALLAYRKRQDVEMEQAISYARHCRTAGHDPRSRELEHERAQDRHEIDRERMIANEDCGCYDCRVKRWGSLTARVYSWDDGDKPGSKNLTDRVYTWDDGDEPRWGRRERRER